MNNPCSRGCGYPYRRPAAVSHDQVNCSRQMTSCVPQRPMTCSQPAPEPRCQERPASCAPQSNCGCAMNWNSKDFPIAMGYVPMQKWSSPMNLCQGLQYGTIFEDLNKPFCGKGGACR